MRGHAGRLVVELIRATAFSTFFFIIPLAPPPFTLSNPPPPPPPTPIVSICPNELLSPSVSLFFLVHSHADSAGGEKKTKKKLPTGPRVIAIKTRRSASEKLIEDKVEVIVPHLAQPLIILYSDKQALKGDTE